MALANYKIKPNEKIENQIRVTAPNTLTGTAEENKQVFDRLSLLLTDRYNSALDEITTNFTTQNAKVDSVRNNLQTQIDDIEGGVNPLVPRGMYATIEDLEEAHPIGEVGEAWLVGDEDENTAYIWDVDQEAWVDVGGLVDGSGFRTAYNKSFESSATNIQPNGTADVGLLDTIPRADHVHPSDSTKADLVAGFLDDEEVLESATITAWNEVLGIS